MFGLYQRDGRVYVEFIKDAEKKTLQDIIKRRIVLESHLYTDTWKSYKGLNKQGYRHQTINHGKQEYVKEKKGKKIGEWGFRELPMEEHFRVAQKFGFKYLEFGIGGGKTGRLPEKPSDFDADEFRRLGKHYGIRTPFCCIENDFTLADANQHRQMLEKVQNQMVRNNTVIKKEK